MDDAAFATLLQSHEAAVRGLLRRLCTFPNDADDLLQETWTKVWRLRASFDPAGNALAWLQQAAFRCFCDHRRRERRTPRTNGGHHDLVGRDPAAAEWRDEVRHRLAVLAPLERDLLLGFHGGGRSLRELAAEHGLPVNTAKSHLHRARRRLQSGGGRAP
ncbi:MAG: sigma-70 family RNA polymerase sigma factor [Planctomycetes bacterium]|nr:sigma-70 family RNA polymerase sigma factor [Planctomycetota bacterium]